jgi:hypothetical protein
MSSAGERAVIPSAHWETTGTPQREAALNPPFPAVESEKGNHMQTHNPPNIEVLYRQDTRRVFGSHIQSLPLPGRY